MPPEQNPQPAAPAEPAAPAPTPAEPTSQPAPAPAPAEPAAPAADPAPADPGASGTPGEGGGEPQGQPQQTRQERRDQERRSRIGELSQQPQQGQQPNQQPFSGQQSPQLPQYQPGQEVSPEQLQQDVVQTASAIAGLQVQRQLQQHDARRNFDQDVSSVPTTYPELNPDNDAYTEELDAAIAQDYQERAFPIVGYDRQTGAPIRQLDPSVRLSDIAKRHVTSARALAAKMSASTQAAVDTAADGAAPRPTGAKPAERPFEALSREEQRAKLGYHKT